MTSFLHDLQNSLQSPTIPWQSIILGLGVSVTLFESWIGSRQKPYLSPILHPTIPAALLPYLVGSSSHDTYLKSQKYAKDKLSFGGILTILDHLETFVLLSSVAGPVFQYLGFGSVGTSVFPYFGLGNNGGTSWTLLKGFWDVAGRLPFASGAGRGEIRHSVAFLILLTTIGSVLSIPKEYYKNFVLEEKHGFNKTSKATFVADQIKGYFLAIALQTPILAGLLWIVKWVGADGMLTVVAWMMAFIFGFQLLFIPLYPYLIAPLFNTYTPLAEDSPVFPLVKDLTSSLNFPLGRVWVMDGSKRSAHSNAFFFGLPFLTKHIVIYDTLLDKSTPEEVQAILAHELGHWKNMDVLKLLATSLIQTAFSLCTFTLFLNNAPLLAAFGFPTSALSSTSGPTLISLLLAANLFTPLQAVLHYLTNSVTRALEYNADAFAVKLGKSYATNLKGALVRIHEENLAIYGVDWIYSAYNHNHPTLVERLEALDKGIAGVKDDEVKESKKEL